MKKKKFQRAFIIGGAPLIAVVTVLIKLPGVEENMPSLIPTGWQYLLISVMVLTTIYTTWLTVHLPLKKLENFENRRWTYFEEIIKFPLVINNIQLKPNIMLVSSEYKKRRFRFRKKPEYFVAIWSPKNHINNKLHFSLNQGVCGRAYDTQDFEPHDVEDCRIRGVLGTEFNMSEEQIKLTKKVTYVASSPLIISKAGEETKIIGVVSVETTIVGAAKKLETHLIEKKIENYLDNIGRWYMLMFKID